MMLRLCVTSQLVLCFVLVAMLSGSACAQLKFISSGFEFTSVAPPVSVTWQLATPAGEHVDLMISNIQPIGFEIAHIVTPENASQYGVDFAAWSLAVNDPNYSRSIMTWAGATQEKPVVRNFPHIELDDLRVFITDYKWPVPGGNSAALFITAFASDNPVVPEPGTCILALTSITWLSSRRCNRSLRCSCRYQRPGS
jgi:hypothetical protein